MCLGVGYFGKYCFSQAPVRSSLCETISFNSPVLTELTGSSCLFSASVLFINSCGGLLTLPLLVKHWIRCYLWDALLALSLPISLSLSVAWMRACVCARALDRARDKLIVPDMSALLILCNQYQRLTDSVLLRQSSLRYCVLHCPDLWHWQSCILMALR